MRKEAALYVVFTALNEYISKDLHTLEQNTVIDAATFNHVRPTGTVIPRIYGLPKLPKENVSLRPIWDMSN